MLVAFIYSSVGHGGASGYLALMAFAGIAIDQMRSSALLLNLFVSAISFYHYRRGGYFRLKIFLPFGIASLPAAFAGALFQFDPLWYKRILGICLLLAAWRIWGISGVSSSAAGGKSIPLWAGLTAGIFIGLVSGMIGIGGGVILSPLLLLFKWADVKETAAVSALFIWLNSAAGLSGLFTSGTPFPPVAFLWVGAAVAGGLAGGYLGSAVLTKNRVRRLLAFVLLLAALKLVWASIL